ncbi:hypothetical protein ACN20G_09025 [Streptomyces sp. BI20]|uniref:hypothetical protein n=1 Tax=Streptomyces sp. BI20 TaxID=3403460 RepID=UPI003C72869D
MELPVLIHRARLGAEEFRVIRPARALPEAELVAGPLGFDLWVDTDACRVLGGLWLLAARSPRSLVHVPLRSGWASAPGDGPRADLDLVLLHHSLRFAPSRWKALRSRLDAGRPTTARLGRGNGGVPEPHRRENRDRFVQHEHAETLFMTGSAPVFRETARHFLDLVHEGPAHARAGAPGHACARFHSADGVLARGAAEIHVVHVPDGSEGPANG